MYTLDAWKTFIESKRTDPELRQPIIESWQRCSGLLNPHQRAHLKPLSEYHFLSAQVSEYDLVTIAKPVIEDIFEFIEHNNAAIFFANRAGYIMEIFGHDDIMQKISHFGIIKGGQFAENSVGTNSVSLALQNHIPSSVWGPEHFLEDLHILDGSSAPVFDVSGNVLGVLGIIHLHDQPNMNDLSLMVTGAKVIETQYQSVRLLKEQQIQMTRLKQMLEIIDEAVLVWDANGILMHVNQTAEEVLELSAKNVVGEAFQDHINFPPFILKAIQDRTTLKRVDALFRVGEKVINCVISLQYMLNNEDLNWVILTIYTENSVRKILLNQIDINSNVTLNDIIGESAKIREVKRQIKLCADASAPVFIRGEAGTHKDLIAATIHNEGVRKNGPFVVFQCSAYPKNSVQDELFGSDKADKKNNDKTHLPGKYELANGGTLYLQNIEGLSRSAQSVLLDALELGAIPINFNDVRKLREVDVRVIASSSVNIEQLIANGNFRSDLYYRLNVFGISVPPLRERKEDIAYLVNHTLARLERITDHSITLADGALELLQACSWPSNDDQMEMTLEKAVIYAGNSRVLTPIHLKKFMMFSETYFALNPEAVQTLENMEHELILRAARAFKGNQTQMSEALGINRSTLWRKMQAYNISIKEFH